jgi:hypothetical protein
LKATSALNSVPALLDSTPGVSRKNQIVAEPARAAAPVRSGQHDALNCHKNQLWFIA